MKIGRRVKQKMITELHNPKCGLCRLRYTDKPQCIMGQGNMNAKLILVCGDLKIYNKKCMAKLHELLHNVGINPAMIYIMSLVKCYPPHDRNPSPRESMLCYHKYSVEEIKIIDPKSIIFMGPEAISLYSPYHYKDMKIGWHAYTYSNLGARYVWVTHHPNRATRSSNIANEIHTALRWGKLWL